MLEIPTERGLLQQQCTKKRDSFRGLRPLNPRQGLCPWTPPGPLSGPLDPMPLLCPTNHKSVATRLFGSCVTKNGSGRRGLKSSVAFESVKSGNDDVLVTHWSYLFFWDTFASHPPIFKNSPLYLHLFLYHTNYT